MPRIWERRLYRVSLSMFLLILVDLRYTAIHQAALTLTLTLMLVLPFSSPDLRQTAPNVNQKVRFVTPPVLENDYKRSLISFWNKPFSPPGYVRHAHWNPGEVLNTRLVNNKQAFGDASEHGSPVINTEAATILPPPLPSVGRSTRMQSGWHFWAGNWGY